MKKLIIIILIPYLITGCATTYHQQNMFGGYSDQKFEKDVYQIGFDTFGFFNDPDMIEQFIQYRCAEVVIKEGFKYYTIIDNYTDTSPNTVTIKIFKEKPDDLINVRDADEVINNVKHSIEEYNKWAKKGNVFSVIVGVPAFTFSILVTIIIMTNNMGSGFY